MRRNCGSFWRGLRTAGFGIWGGQFGLGDFTLEALIKITKEHDFAIMILTQDDLINRRGKNTFVPRDNVVFELGLFMGALGRDRTFIVHDKRMAMPSDLDGITRAEFLEMSDLRNACRKLRDAMICTPPHGQDLDGRWLSAYQRHDAKVGRWARDFVEIKTISPGKLLFRNSLGPKGSNYKAIGHFENQNEIVGAWYETLDTAYGRGTFHLYKDPYFPKMYGVCTGPTSKGQPVYSGWILARENHAQLAEARRDLMESMLIARYKLPVMPEFKKGQIRTR